MTRWKSVNLTNHGQYLNILNVFMINFMGQTHDLFQNLVRAEDIIITRTQCRSLSQGKAKEETCLQKPTINVANLEPCLGRRIARERWRCRSCRGRGGRSLIWFPDPTEHRSCALRWSRASFWTTWRYFPWCGHW